MFVYTVLPLSRRRPFHHHAGSDRADLDQAALSDYGYGSSHASFVATHLTSINGLRAAPRHYVLESDPDMSGLVD